MNAKKIFVFCVLGLTVFLSGCLVVLRPRVDVDVHGTYYYRNCCPYPYSYTVYGCRACPGYYRYNCDGVVILSPQKQEEKCKKQKQPIIK